MKQLDLTNTQLEWIEFLIGKRKQADLSPENQIEYERWAKAGKERSRQLWEGPPVVLPDVGKENRA